MHSILPTPLGPQLLASSSAQLCECECQLHLKDEETGSQRGFNALSQGQAASKHGYSQEPKLLTTVRTARRPQFPRNTDDIKHIWRKETGLARGKTSDQLQRRGKALGSGPNNQEVAITTLAP